MRRGSLRNGLAAQAPRIHVRDGTHGSKNDVGLTEPRHLRKDPGGSKDAGACTVLRSGTLPRRTNHGGGLGPRCTWGRRQPESVRRGEDSPQRSELHGSPRRREEDPLLAMFHTWSPHKQQDFLRVHGQKYPRLALDYRQAKGKASVAIEETTSSDRRTVDDTDAMSVDSSAVTGLGIA